MIVSRRGSEFYVYQHSYLGYGVLAARAKMFEQAAHMELTLKNPCLLHGLEVAYVYNGEGFGGVGVGSLAQVSIL